MIFNGATFKGGEILLDGNEYHRCTFEDCVLVYCGGKLVSENCLHIRCQHEFRGAAAGALRFLCSIYHSEGGKEIVEATFEFIRTGFQDDRSSIVVSSN